MKTAIAILVSTMILAGTAEKPVERSNRINFGKAQSGQTLRLFMRSTKGYKKGKPVTYKEFFKPDDIKSIWSEPPEGLALAKSALGKIEVIQVSAPKNSCGTFPRLLFISGPPKKSASGPSLWVYEFNVCDNTGLIPPKAMIERYIAKYGLYDKKDYERNMIVYHGVREHYKVGVRPFTPAKGSRGITITVVDQNVFTEKYFAWRRVLTKASESVQELF